MGLMVIDSGFWTTVQDAGRVGYREWGVPTGGAFDRGAADLANALVGNGSDVRRPGVDVARRYLRGTGKRGDRPRRSADRGIGRRHGRQSASGPNAVELRAPCR